MTGPEQTVYLYVCALTLILGAVMAMVGAAWPRLTWRRRKDRAGDVLASVSAARTGLRIRPAIPGGRPLHVEQRDAFDAIAAANPDLAAVDVLRLADLYLIPAPEETS